MKKMLKSNKGFSLVELLIALLIMAVIAAIAIGLFGGILNTTKSSADNETAETIKKAIMTYMNASNDMQLEMLGGTPPAAAGGLGINGNAVVATLCNKFSVTVDASNQRDAAYATGFPVTNYPSSDFDEVTLSTNETNTNIQPGVYGPLLDATKIAPQNPDNKAWKITIHKNSLRVDVTPVATDEAVQVAFD